MDPNCEMGLWFLKRNSSRKAEYHHSLVVEGIAVDEMEG